MQTKMSFSLRNDLSELKLLALKTEEFSERAKLAMKDSFSLNLVLDELITNIINYGYEDKNEHLIDVTLSYYASQLNIELSDDAIAFDPTQKEKPTLDEDLLDRAIGGLGIHFANEYMDNLQYQRVNQRNILHLTKTFE